MANLREASKAYEPQKTPTVAELEGLSLDSPIEDREGKDKKGKTFKYKVAIVAGDEYRVPLTVLKDIQTIMEAKPSLKTVRVIKKGEGMGASYTVVPLE
jgi:hypothetical protein